MRYLITGHTGFKGSWLTLWLASQGHSVSGLSLHPEADSLFEIAKVEEMCDFDERGDIRNPETVERAMTQTKPDVVVHLAAQPLVLESYRRPRWTMETNVMGTFNVLESVRRQGNVRALLVVTTDKVYRNVSQLVGYRESDSLGGDDPYSASKAMADILTQSWSKSYPGTRTAVARAGNVIGGGDISTDRLLPDIISSLRAGSTPKLRNPDAIRPWQHVLDCLNGYLALIEKLVDATSEIEFGGGWNFGSDADSSVSVGEITRLSMKKWGDFGAWVTDSNQESREAQLLALDSTRAQVELGWNNLLEVEDAVDWTLSWYRELEAGTSARDVTLQQIRRFQSLL